jgi:peptide/nickel transport system substrate-binding protein
MVTAHTNINIMYVKTKKRGTKKLRKKSFSIIAAAMSLVFVMVTCGWSAVAAAKNVEQIIKASDASKVPASAKDRSDTLIVGTGAFNGEFNPIFSSSVYDSWATGLIFDAGLMTNDDSGNPKLWMAESYKIGKDGKTYTFKIRKNIKFSNGNTVTAKDFANTYFAIADKAYDGARTDVVENLVGYLPYHKGYAKTMAGIKVVDDYTIQFTEATVKASALLQDFGYAPLDSKTFAFAKTKVGTLKKLYNDAMGAGAYKLVTSKPGQYIEFVRNDNYWRGTPKIKKIIMKKTDAANAIQELSTGGTDIDKVAAKPKNVDMLKEAKFLDLHLYPANGYGYMGFNTRDPLFSDKRVRQALTYGLDRAGFVNAYYKEYAEVCNAPVSIVSWAYTDKVNQYAYNPKKAAQLLDAAGWKLKKDGWRYNSKNQKFTIHWLTYTGSAYVDTLIPIVKANWKALGIDVVPELMEFSTLSDKVYKYRKFQMWNMAWSLSIDPDPSGIFAKSQDVSGGFNAGGWVNAKSEALMKAGLVETNQAKRAKIYQEWCKLANEELPYIFLNQGKDMYVSNARVTNLHVGPYRDWTVDIEKLELAK